TSDFVKGGALKLGDRACCVKCGPTLLATLNPKEQEQFFREAAKLKASTPAPGTARHVLPASPAPAVRPAPAKPAGPPLALWVGIAVVALIVGLAMALRGNTPATPPPAGPTAREPAPPPPVAPPSPRVRSAAELREEEAARKLEELKATDKSGRFAADEIRRRYAEFGHEYADTAAGRSIAGRTETAAPVPPKVPEPAVPEPKPEPPKEVEAPKPPEPPKPVPAEPKPLETKVAEPLVKAPAVPKRPPVPEAARLRDAEAAVRKTFNVDAAKTPKDKADLARTLLQTASASGAKDVELYALLRMAKTLAAQGGALKVSLEAIDRTGLAFDVDAMGEKVELFAKTTLKPTDAATWGAGALDVAEEASQAEEYDSAIKLAGRAEALGRSANDRGLQETAKERAKELSDLKRAADGLKAHVKTLESKPDDPAANAAVGKFTCLVKGDWKRGLPMLVKGSEPALKTLAELELATPVDAAAQAALGESWAAQAEKETPTYKTRERSRAAEWLSRALPGLSGLTKVSAEKKLASLGPVAFSKEHPVLDLGPGARVELIYVRAGSFTMGGTIVPVAVWEADQRPEHRVTLTRGYYLGRTEVTRGQFAAFVKATGYKTDAERQGNSWGLTSSGWADVPGLTWQNPNFPQTDDHPAICISWNDAKAFCDWATKKTGRAVRLPTEAEWEYACRAGTKTAWSFGDDEAAAGDYMWNMRNSSSQTHPVGLKKPNPWGFYDIHGNAWEWCQDWIAPYPAEAVDPTGPSTGELRSFRGGRWDTVPPFGHCMFRGQAAPTTRASYTGFRVAAQ
ncbi:MAG: SUMF1/EgtB/PvdO family nonheme iron enzyme, partial [Planctomycetaceae bacterium]|nr:SUMF1/EgtB/PvdO family nonheme iron enzyme [Planctomycetaceae bacterium]